MSRNKIYFIGLLAIIASWIAEAYIHVKFFHADSFSNQLFRPGMHELWMRFIVSLAILLLTFYVHSFYRLREMQKLLADALKTAEEEKAKREAVIAGIGDGIVVQDTDYRIIFQNRIETGKYGDCIGEYCYKVYEGRGSVCEDCPVSRSFTDGNVHTAERMIRSGGRTEYFELTSSPIRDADGKIIAGIKIIRDITDRKKSESRLIEYQKSLEELVRERTYELQASNDFLKEEIEDRRKAQEKYHSLFENMLNAFAYHEIVVDDHNSPVDYRFLEVNRSFENLTGLKRENIIGRKVTDIIPGIRNTRPDLIKVYGNVALTGEHASFEFFFEPFQKWYSVSAYSPETGYFVSIFDDITEGKLLEKSLIDVEERERRRIGHDLHDGLGQLLTGLAFKIRGLGRMLETNSLPQAEEVADISVLIDEAKEQVSSLSQGLSPVSMDEEGLMSAFRSLSYYTNKMFLIPCTFKCDVPVTVHDSTVLMQLYRITQEAVTNAAKHANPHHIEIILGREDGNIIITIRDDGTGIPETIENKGTMGLKIMRYRAGIINASLEIKKNVNGGTVVTCVLPDSSQGGAS